MTVAAVEFIRDADAWRTDAACRGRSALFFAEDPFSERVALAVCRACPVRVECAATAAVEERGATAVYGVRGGRTAEQRRRR